jgi:alpha-tubulin suppressor-like RCC1 family protein
VRLADGRGKRLRRGQALGLLPPEQAHDRNTDRHLSDLSNVIAIDASNTSSYALESNGTMLAWGENHHGQLGDGGEGTTGASYTEAVKVAFPPGVSVTAIGEAQNDGFAIDSEGQGWAVGETQTMHFASAVKTRRMAGAPTNSRRRSRRNSACWGSPTS